MRRSAGLSLVEILVALGLLLLLAGLAVGLLLPALRAAASYRERAALGQTALVAIAKLQQAAKSTSPGGFSWSDGPRPAVAFNPHLELQPLQGLLVWSPQFDLFWLEPAAGELRSVRWPPEEDPMGDEFTRVKAKRLPAARLAQLVEERSTFRAMASQVRRFEVEQRGDAETLRLPVFLTLELGPEGDRDQLDPRSLVRYRFALQLVKQQ